MTGDKRNTVVVGGSVAGIGVVDELRRLGYDRPITLIDAQPHLPYDRPPLSKGIIAGSMSWADLLFHDAEYYEQAGVELLLGTRVGRLIAATRTLELESGERLVADNVVIASGAHPRPLPGGHVGVHLLRERDDAARMRADLDGASRVAIVGGGFIGAEVASSVAALGLQATMIELARHPFEALLGADVAALIVDLHQAAGVSVRSGVGVEQITHAGRIDTLTLSDGTTATADVTIAGLGAIPAIDWLVDSELELDDGVVCDVQGQTSAPGVFAAGDVARWSSGDPTVRRHEHWTSARDQGRIVAHTIPGLSGPRWEDCIPYVWSDQHGKRIQILGNLRDADAIEVVEHDAAKGAFLALYGREEQLVGAVGLNKAAQITRQRLALAAGTSFREAVDAFATRPLSGGMRGGQR